MWDRLKPALGFLAVVAFIVVKHLAQGGSRNGTAPAFSPGLLLAIGGGAIGVGLVIYWKGRRCPSCKAWDVVPLESPAGRLVLEHPPAYDPRKYDKHGRRKYSGWHSFLILGAVILMFVALMLALVLFKR